MQARILGVDVERDEEGLVQTAHGKEKYSARVVFSEDV